MSLRLLGAHHVTTLLTLLEPVVFRVDPAPTPGTPEPPGAVGAVGAVVFDRTMPRDLP